MEQQTATSEILGVIASSPTDIQPVLDTSRGECGAAVRRDRCADLSASTATFFDWWRHYGSIPASTREASDHVDRGQPCGRAILDRRDDSYSRPCCGAETEFPEPGRSQQASALELCLATPLLREGIANRRNHHSPHGSPSFHGEADHASRNLRRPSRHRDRERAVVQGTAGAQRRIARGPGASDGNGRGARHHQPLADGRAAGARRHRRERGPGLWDR